jgi:hypothetical protein
VTDTAAELLQRLGRRLESLRKVRRSSDVAAGVRAIRGVDRDHMYESTFLQAVSAFETFQEDLFYSSILNRSDIRTVAPTVSFRNRVEAERALLAGDKRGFLSWSSMTQNITRAEIFLVGGRPFSRLRRRGNDLRVLDTVTRVRNAVAHTSGSAMDRFRSLAKGGLMSRKRTPAGYLQSASGTATQHEVLLNELERLAKALAAATDRTAWPLLRDEDPYKSGSSVPRGTFECTKCRTRIFVAATGTIFPCSNCSKGACPHCGREGATTYSRIR